MKILYQRTLEKLITGVLVFSFIISLGAPALAQGVEDVQDSSVVVPVSTPELPELKERSVKATWYVTATAYSSDVWQNDSTPFLPANGIDYREVFKKEGVVNCVALNDLRLGSKVRFPDLYGDTVYTVCDRTNARYTGQKRSDFYFYSVDENGSIESKVALDTARKNARQFGIKRKVKMEILDFSTPVAKKSTAVLAKTQ